MEGSPPGGTTLLERNSERQNPSVDLKVKLVDALDALKVLPAVQQKDLINEKMQAHRVLLADMEPGTGKSFGLPVIGLNLLLETNPDARIIVSESRKKLVEQLGGNGPKENDGTQKPEDMTLKDRLGTDIVGFSNKDNRAPATARIDFAVEQTLINRLISNPALTGTDMVIVDEAHRNMGILKPLIKRAMELNPSLKVVFATGTADAARDRLYGMFPDMGEIKIEGRKHEIDNRYHQYSTAKSAPLDAARLSEDIIQKGEEKGNIIVFLQGGKELNDYIDYLNKSSVINPEEIEIIRVMGKDKGTMDMLKAVTSKRRIIVTTNALEEGVDPNCDIAIVSGWRKTKEIDPVTGIEQYKTIRVARSSAEQQAKRVGRKRPGVAHFLFEKVKLENPNEFPVEDLENRDLTNDILTLIAAGWRDIRGFEFEDEKDPSHIEAVIGRLQKLGALDKDENMTEIGQYMADKDTEPRFARMMYESEKRGCDDAVAILVGIMSSDSQLFQRDAKNKFGHPDSDFLAMIEVWNKFVKITYNNDLTQPQKNEQFKEMEQSGVNIQVLRDAAQARRDSVKIQGNLYPEIILTGEGDKSEAIKISVLAGLIDRYMYRDPNGSYHLESGKKSGIRINSDSGLTFKNPAGLVSGKISHSGKYGDTAEFNQAVNENEMYELFPYLSEYRLNKSVAEKEPEKKVEVAPTVVQPEQDTQEQKNLDVQAERIVQNVSTHSEEAASDAKTFIQKVKDNWHNLSEKVKSYFKSLSEKLKRLVGIK